MSNNQFLPDQSNFFKVRIYLTALLALVTAGLVVADLVPLLNGLLLVPFALGLCLLSRPVSTRLLLGLILLPTVFMGFFIAMYRPSGFNYPLLSQAESLYPGGERWMLFVNFSKGLGGCLVVLWLGSVGYARSRIAANGAFPSGMDWLLAIGGALIVLGVANVLFGVAWQPKIANDLLAFLVVNLLVTVLAEEAFFRLLLQDQIARFCKAKVAIWVSVALVALLFSVSHSGAVGPAFFLYLIAGTVYALVYTVTRRLTVSVVTHFSVNVGHFVFLEYPL